MKTVLHRDKGACIPILFPILGIIMIFLAAVTIYMPGPIKLQSTAHSFVTSTTPNNDTNFFDSDENSSFHTMLAFRNCTLL